MNNPTKPSFKPTYCLKYFFYHNYWHISFPGRHSRQSFSLSVPEVLITGRPEGQSFNLSDSSFMANIENGRFVFLVGNFLLLA